MTIATYESLLEDEYKASGRLPKVAVIGHQDFDALSGEMLTMFGLLLIAKPEYPRDWHEYKGAALFKSYAHKHGVWFGGGEV